MLNKNNIGPRLIGAFLVIVVYCVPANVIIWYLGSIDELSTRIAMSVFAAIMPAVAFLSEPKPQKSIKELLWFALFMVLVLLLATGQKFNLGILSSNTIMLFGSLPWCWLVWKLIGGSLFLLTGLILEFAVMMIYWVAAPSEVVGHLDVLLLPLPLALFGGIF